MVVPQLKGGGGVASQRKETIQSPINTITTLMGYEFQFALLTDIEIVKHVSISKADFWSSLSSQNCLPTTVCKLRTPSQFFLSIHYHPKHPIQTILHEYHGIDTSQ